MILTLSSENVRNTVFTDERGLALFRSATPFRLGTRTTTISRQTSDQFNPTEVMGSIEWHCFGSSIFNIWGKRLESNVFSPRQGIFGRKRIITGPDGRRYRWDMHQWDVVLSLDEGSQTEIARYYRRTLGIIGKRRSPRLEIAPETEHMQDLIVLTFIYVEKLRMDKEEMEYEAASGG